MYGSAPVRLVFQSLMKPFLLINNPDCSYRASPVSDLDTVGAVMVLAVGHFPLLLTVLVALAGPVLLLQLSQICRLCWNIGWLYIPLTDDWVEFDLIYFALLTFLLVPLFH